jgi:dextranase
MDPSAGSPWCRHLLAEGAQTLQSIPFDGLHIDQYGDPKRARDVHHNLVDLPRAFVDFIQSASDQHSDKTIIFNAVGNWPIEALANSAVDFMYIEVWPPDLEYRHLAEVVLNAVRLSHGKAVVIAHYLPDDRPANNLLTDTVILACGGTRIELGEEARLLSDPYFPKHEGISSYLYTELRLLADFSVRNGEWLRPYTLSAAEKELWSEGVLNSKLISTDESIMNVMRQHPKLLVVQMVIFTDLDSHQQWDVVHTPPTPRQNIAVKIQMVQKPAQVLWDCPEQIEGPQSISFEHSNKVLTFHIPQIIFTGLVVIRE